MVASIHQDNQHIDTTSQSCSTLYLCGSCKHPVGWDTKGVLCEHCDTWYHISCQAIPSAYYSQLDHSSLTWTCIACNSLKYSTTSAILIADNHDINLSDHITVSVSENAETSIDSIDYQQQPIHESSPTKFKPTPAKQGQSLRLINVNCQLLPGKKGTWINLIYTT